MFCNWNICEAHDPNRSLLSGRICQRGGPACLKAIPTPRHLFWTQCKYSYFSETEHSDRDSALRQGGRSLINREDLQRQHSERVERIPSALRLLTIHGASPSLHHRRGILLLLASVSTDLIRNQRALKMKPGWRDTLLKITILIRTRIRFARGR